VGVGGAWPRDFAGGCESVAAASGGGGIEGTEAGGGGTRIGGGEKVTGGGRTVTGGSGPGGGLPAALEAPILATVPVGIALLAAAGMTPGGPAAEIVTSGISGTGRNRVSAGGIPMCVIRKKRLVDEGSGCLSMWHHLCTHAQHMQKLSSMMSWGCITTWNEKGSPWQHLDDDRS
jgi:hypothetical protein